MIRSAGNYENYFFHLTELDFTWPKALPVVKTKCKNFSLNILHLFRFTAILQNLSVSS